MSENPHLTLVLGGARSGKSAYAESLIVTHPSPWTYIATADILDEEMRARVDAHRARRGEDWRTVEAAQALVEAIRRGASRSTAADRLSHALAEQSAAWRRRSFTRSRRACSCVVVPLGADRRRLVRGWIVDRAGQRIGAFFSGCGRRIASGCFAECGTGRPRRRRQSADCERAVDHVIISALRAKFRAIRF